MTPTEKPSTPGVVRCPCGCGQILFAVNPSGDAVVIRCGRGFNTELRMSLRLLPLEPTAGSADSARQPPPQSGVTIDVTPTRPDGKR